LSLTYRLRKRLTIVRIPRTILNIQNKILWLFRFWRTIFESAIENYGVSCSSPISPHWATTLLPERLWKFVKKKCLYNVYDETFEQFKEGISDCLKQVDQQYKEEVATLMNPEFQNFKNYKILLA
jgi:hypothetical protein